MKPKPWCGGINVWTITYGETPDDYTHSCAEHLHEMLESCMVESQENKTPMSVWPAEKDARCCWLEQVVIQ